MEIMESYNFLSYLCYFPVFAKHLNIKQWHNRKEKVKAFRESISFQSIFAY